MGNTYRDQGDYVQALESFQRAAELDPQSPWPHHNTGIIYAAQQQWEQARDALLQAATLQPDNASNHGALATVYYQLGDQEAGDRHLALARPLMEKQSEYNRACFEAIAGNRRAALDLLRVALEKAPGMKGWAQRDSDFISLRDDPEFRALVGLAAPVADSKKGDTQ
jgi:Flp pilus assembly protein TadD